MSEDNIKQLPDSYMDAATSALKELTKARNLMTLDTERTLKSFIDITNEANATKSWPLTTQEEINKAEKGLAKIKAEYASVYNDYRNSVNKYISTVNINSQLLEENYKGFIISILTPVPYDKSTSTEKLERLFTTIRDLVAESERILQTLADFTNNVIDNAIANDKALESSKEVLIKTKEQLLITSINISKFSEEAISNCKKACGQAETKENLDNEDLQIQEQKYLQLTIYNLDQVKEIHQILHGEVTRLLEPYFSVTAKMQLLKEQSEAVLREKDLYSDRTLTNLRDQLIKYVEQYKLLIEDFISCLSKYSSELGKISKSLEENYKNYINATLALMADKSKRTPEKLRSTIAACNKIGSNIENIVEFYVEFASRLTKLSMAKEDKAKGATSDLIATIQRFSFVGKNMAKISQEAINICIRDYTQE
jgi:hypothetical protein